VYTIFAIHGEGEKYRLLMKTKQLQRELKKQGATFKEGKRHTKVYLDGKQSTIPRHVEIPDELAKVIRKQLGVG
jgi:mRNA interferase HicA